MSSPKLTAEDITSVCVFGHRYGYSSSFKYLLDCTALYITQKSYLTLINPEYTGKDRLKKYNMCFLADSFQLYTQKF